MPAIDDKFYCPKCHSELQRFDGCGTVGYMCNSCKRLISRKEMLTKEETENKNTMSLHHGTEMET